MLLIGSKRFYAHTLNSEHAQPKRCTVKRIYKSTYYINSMRNLHNFIEDNHWLEALHLLLEWEKWEIKDSDYRNHRRFTLRCISKDLIPVSVRLKSTSNSRSRRAKEIIYCTEKHLLQDRIKCINDILYKNVY